jgi:2'-5' RNA ligase
MPDARGRLQTAVVIVLREARPALEPVREELDPSAAARRIPLHVTLLFPFVPRDEITHDQLDRLRSLFARRAPFAFSLTGIGEFPGVVYARPEPDDELRTLMRALWDEFPKLPPYEGEVDDPAPHATLGRVPEGTPQEEFARLARGRAAGLLPLDCHVDEVTLLEEHRPDRWRESSVFPLSTS